MRIYQPIAFGKMAEAGNVRLDMPVIAMCLELLVREPIGSIVDDVHVGHECTEVQAAFHKMLAYEPQTTSDKNQLCLHF